MTLMQISAKVVRFMTGQSITVISFDAFIGFIIEGIYKYNGSLDLRLQQHDTVHRSPTWRS